MHEAPRGCAGDRELLSTSLLLASSPLSPSPRYASKFRTFRSLVLWAAVESAEDLVRTRRLDDVCVEPCLEGSGSIRRLTIAGHRDQTRFGVAHAAPDLSGNFVAVHLGKADVDQRDVGLLAEDRLDGGRPVGDDGHLVATQAQQI